VPGRISLQGMAAAGDDWVTPESPFQALPVPSWPLNTDAPIVVNDWGACAPTTSRLRRRVGGGDFRDRPIQPLSHLSECVFITGYARFRKPRRRISDQTSVRLGTAHRRCLEEWRAESHLGRECHASPGGQGNEQPTLKYARKRDQPQRSR